MSEPDALEIEEAAFAAWPAAEVRVLGPWRLRAMAGVTHRANSVWAGPGVPPGGLEAALDAVERFYAERDSAAVFQLFPFSDPALDARLAARGFAAFEPSSVQLAAVEQIAALPACPGARCDPEPSAAWFEVSGRRGRFRGPATEVYRGLLERLAGRAGFASACAADGRVAAVGMIVVAPPLAGVFSMLTLPEARRRGLGAAVLGELARFAAARGARQLYLQVEADNVPAVTLYARSSFREHHRYHYRRGAGRLPR